MVITKHMTIPAKVAELHQLSDTLEDLLSSAGCPIKTAMGVQLSAEELFVNVANYAYKDQCGDVHVIVTADAERKMVSITFTDNGVPFNPLEKEDADVSLSAEERKIGGLGIYLVKKNMDRMLYEYKNNQNNVTIIKSW